MAPASQLIAYLSIESFLSKVKYYKKSIESFGDSMPHWVMDRLNEFHPVRIGFTNVA